MAGFSAFLDLVLFLVTVLVVGRNPTFHKVSAMILVIACTEALVDSLYASTAGLGLYDWYLQALQESAQNLAQVSDSVQSTALESSFEIVAGCLPAIYLLQAALDVFVALGLMWVVNKLLKRQTGWQPVSSIDLPVWTVAPLIVGCLLKAVSNIPQAPNSRWLLLVAVNLIGVEAILLYVQGFAALKGLMNSTGITAVTQFLIVLVAMVFGVFFLITPVIGLVDYWANIRKLSRDG